MSQTEVQRLIGHRGLLPRTRRKEALRFSATVQKCRVTEEFSARRAQIVAPLSVVQRRGEEKLRLGPDAHSETDRDQQRGQRRLDRKIIHQFVSSLG